MKFYHHQVIYQQRSNFINPVEYVPYLLSFTFSTVSDYTDLHNLSIYLQSMIRILLNNSGHNY